MARLIFWRVLGMIPLLIIISVLTTLLIEFVPGDPAYAILGENATPEALETVREELGLGEPFFERYLNWIGGVLRGDLGRSLFGQVSVSQAIRDRAPVTVALIAGAVLFQIAFGVGTGIGSGFRPRSRLDRTASLLAGLLLAVPAFWLGMLLVLVFSQKLGWLPSTGYVPLSGGLWPFVSHLILPSLALAAAGAAELFRQTRASVVDTSKKDFVRAKRAFGTPERSIAMRHVAKNSMVPVVTVFGLQLGRMIGTAAVVESVFGIQGIGSLAVTASLNGDFPVIQGVVLITATVVLVVNLLVDISYRYFNPKLRVA